MAALTLVTVVLSLLNVALAESHAITFTNKCGYGTPYLIQGSNVLSNGETYTPSGPLDGAIAYLSSDQHKCGFNGEGCTFLELTVGDGSSSVDISLISPHAFSDGAGFTYTGACNGQGAYCGEASCNTAFKVSDDTCVQVGCSGNDAGVDITFCGGTTGFLGGWTSTGSPCNGSGGGPASSSNSTAPGSSSTQTTSTSSAFNGTSSAPA